MANHEPEGWQSKLESVGLRRVENGKLKVEESLRDDLKCFF